jgi:hypothetical protein
MSMVTTFTTTLDWNNLAQERDQRKALVNNLMNLQVA